VLTVGPRGPLDLATALGRPGRSDRARLRHLSRTLVSGDEPKDAKLGTFGPVADGQSRKAWTSDLSGNPAEVTTMVSLDAQRPRKLLAGKLK